MSCTFHPSPFHHRTLPQLIAARALELGEVTQDLIALSLADGEREWGYQGSSIDWQAVSNIACTLPPDRYCGCVLSVVPLCVPLFGVCYVSNIACALPLDCYHGLSVFSYCLLFTLAHAVTCFLLLSHLPHLSLFPHPCSADHLQVHGAHERHVPVAAHPGHRLVLLRRRPRGGIQNGQAAHGTSHSHQYFHSCEYSTLNCGHLPPFVLIFLSFFNEQLELEASLARFDVKVTSLIQSSLEVVPRNLHKVI